MASPSASSAIDDGNRDANRDRTRIVLKEVFRSVSRSCHAKNSEGSTWGLCLSRPEPIRRQDAYVVCRAESFISGAGRSSATVAVGQPVVENARHGGDQSIVIALAGGTAGELDGSRQRSFDHEGIRPSAGEHRERTTIRRREVGAGNGKRSRVGADRSSGRPPTESEPIGDRGDKLITRIGPSSGQIDRQTNRVPDFPLFVPVYPLFVPVCLPVNQRRPRTGRGDVAEVIVIQRDGRP